MKYEGLSMTAWFLPSTTSPASPPPSSTCPRETEAAVGGVRENVQESFKKNNKKGKKGFS